MTDELPCKDGNALWAAVTARAKTEAQASSAAAGALLRRFIVDRFLARIFALPGDEWVLKGGNAVLTRVHDARTTKDIDLLAELSDLDAAVARLRVDRLYPAEARRVPACGDTVTLAAATELVTALLSPVFDRTATGKQWDPSSRSWNS
jgi:hypothetical protein